MIFIAEKLQGTIINQSFNTLWSEKFPHALKGGVVYDLDEKTFLFSDNADKNFMISSSQKVVTALLALEILGAEFRYETCLYADGPIRNHVLEGNLIIIGSGDPSMDFNFQGQKGGSAVVQKWVESLKQKGIQTIRGKILVDDSAFEANGIGKGWMCKDLPYSWGAPISTFSLNRNGFRIEVTPNKNLQQPPSIKFLESCENLTLINKILTTEAKDKDKRSFDFDLAIEHNGEITISGYIAQNSQPVVYSIIAPDQKAAVLRLFNRELTAKKITTQNKSLLQTVEPILIDKHVSPPLIDLLSHTVKYSNNFYAECIFKTLSLKANGKGTSNDSIAITTKFLNTIGISSQNFKIGDGSGLSRYNFMAPTTMCKILEYIYNSSHFEHFKKILVFSKENNIPFLKHYTGTIPNIWFKTGRSTGISSIAGFLTTKHKKNLIFVFLLIILMSPLQRCMPFLPIF